jgi:hypothetical protein
MSLPRNRRNEEKRRHTFERTKKRIEGRVRCYCPHMTDAEFELFAGRMATIEIKYSLRRNLDYFGGRSREDGRDTTRAAAPPIASDVRGNLRAW